MSEETIRRRKVLKTVAGTGVALAVGTGTANASHNPIDFRIEFNRQTRRLDVDEPSVLVARAYLPDDGLVMVHETHDMDNMGDMDNGGCPEKHDIYGEKKLDAGHHGGVKIPLKDVPDDPGTEELKAMIHTVGGDGHKCPPEVHKTADVTFISPPSRSQ